MTRAIQLSAASVEQYGPEYLAPMVRAVFGGPITLDPFSCYQANLLIGAEAWYGPEWAALGHESFADGFTAPWFGDCYVNPPGGRMIYQGRSVNRAALAYATLAWRFHLGHVSQAVFMIFNMETLRHALRYDIPQPLEFPVCVPKSRIDFWKPGPEGRPIPQGAPGHPNMLVYMGPNINAFREVFTPPLPGTEWNGGRVFDGRLYGDVGT